MENDRKGLDELAREGITPEDFAQIVIENPEVSRQGLERVLESHPETFREAVPQPFDDQTGLWSKTYFEGHLINNTIERAEGEGTPLSYILFDLDGFHEFNDLYGRVKGDEAIRLFCDLLRKEFRTNIRRGISILPEVDKRGIGDRRKKYRHIDYIGRVPDYTHGRVGGGEEFAVLLYGVNEAKSLQIADF